mmetsp:Transcript_28552/g.52413  ORF Transcript_28552/g.52413 Transcript_28552/m.52413 type:complete len:174 (-) Transcript_28552:381-902(-)
MCRTAVVSAVLVLVVFCSDVGAVDLEVENVVVVNIPAEEVAEIEAPDAGMIGDVPCGALNHELVDLILVDVGAAVVVVAVDFIVVASTTPVTFVTVGTAIVNVVVVSDVIVGVICLMVVVDVMVVSVNVVTVIAVTIALAAVAVPMVVVQAANTAVLVVFVVVFVARVSSSWL